MPTGATIAAVIPALRTFRDQQRAHPRTVNLCRTTVLGLLRHTFGRHHRLWTEAACLPSLKEHPVLVRRPLTPDQLRALVATLPESYGQQVWAQATTGMGWKKYTGRWEREGEGLRIHGGKTKGRDRLIPWVGPISQPRTTIYAYRYHLTKAGVTPYDLRRTFAGLMVEANIPRPRRRAYLGHSADDITAIYEAQEVREYLTKDAERLRERHGQTLRGRPAGDGLGQLYRATACGSVTATFAVRPAS